MRCIVLYIIEQNRQSTVVLIEIVICNAVLIWVNGGVSSNTCCGVVPRFGTFPSWPYHYQRQYLKSKTGYKWCSIVQQKRHALQWYTIQYTSLVSKLTLDIICFPKSNFLWELYHLIRVTTSYFQHSHEKMHCDKELY